MTESLRTSVDSRPAGDETVAIVRAEGEIDLGNADEFEAALGSPLCAASDRVVVDLVDVPFMDSSGLRVLLVAAEELERELAVAVGADSPVLRLLELAEVTGRLRVHETAEDAVEGVGSESPNRG